MVSFSLRDRDRSQRGPANVDDDETYADIEGRSYAIPNRIRELLDGYLIATFGAVAPAPVGCFPAVRAWPDPVEWCS